MTGIGPFTEQVHLEHGGELTITRFGDGEIRMSYEKDGVRFSAPLTARDVAEARLAFNAVKLADQVAWATRS